MVELKDLINFIKYSLRYLEYNIDIFILLLFNKYINNESSNFNEYMSNKHNISYTCDINDSLDIFTRRIGSNDSYTKESYDKIIFLIHNIIEYIINNSKFLYSDYLVSLLGDEEALTENIYAWYGYKPPGVNIITTRKFNSIKLDNFNRPTFNITQFEENVGLIHNFYFDTCNKIFNIIFYNIWFFILHNKKDNYLESNDDILLLLSLLYNVYISFFDNEKKESIKTLKEIFSLAIDSFDKLSHISYYFQNHIFYRYTSILVTIVLSHISINIILEICNELIEQKISESFSQDIVSIDMCNFADDNINEIIDKFINNCSKMEKKEALLKPIKEIITSFNNDKMREFNDKIKSIDINRIVDFFCRNNKESFKQFIKKLLAKLKTVRIKISKMNPIDKLTNEELLHLVNDEFLFYDIFDIISGSDRNDKINKFNLLIRELLKI